MEIKTKIEEQTLVFNDDSIIVEETSENAYAGFEIMMSWEDSVMKRHAEVACENGGHILEIGFGMGISANYIQQQNPESHTIIESHPQIIEKLKDWAADKPSVNIVEGKWIDVIDSLSVYDGIFYDAFGDLDWPSLKEECKKITKTGSIITLWNNGHDTTDNAYGFADGVSYEEIDINPPQNSYFNRDKYYLLKVVI
jgi:protein arginine N-methyltransferase 2